MLRKLFFIIFLFVSSYVWSQQPLTLKECRELAIQNNKKLKISEQEVLASKAMKEEAFTKYLPSLDASGIYKRNQKTISLLEKDVFLPGGTFNESGVWTPNGTATYLPKSALESDNHNVALVKLGLTQPLYLGGKIRAYNQLAGLAENISLSQRDLELQNIILVTDEAYWQVISLINRQQLAEKYVETLKKLDHDINVMYTTGVVTKADVLSVKVKLNEAEMTKFKIEDGLSLSRMSLNQICGLSTDTIYVLEAENDILDNKAIIPKIDLEKVYTQRPEIMSLQLATEISRKKEIIAHSEYLPQIALTAGYMAHTPSFYDGISTKFDGNWSVGVGVNIPIFYWGASRKHMRQMKAQTEITKFRLDAAKEQIELQVSQSEFKIREVNKKMEMAEYNLENAEENLKLANIGFQEGTIAASDVLEAQTNWISASSDLIDVKIEIKLCELYLKKAYGTLTIDSYK